METWFLLFNGSSPDWRDEPTIDLDQPHVEIVSR